MKWMGLHRIIRLTSIALMLFSAFIAEALAQTDSLSKPIFSARYAADQANTVSRTLSGPSEFKVNDISNGSWQLTVPQQQYSSSEVEIKVSPLSYVEMDTTLGTAIGGLMFEPSGLLLSKPIKVNITFQEDFKRPLMFLLFDANGELSHVPAQQVNGREYTIEIPHFSGMVAVEPSNSPNLCTLWRIQLQLAIQEGEKLLTNQPPLGAEPLSINPKCKKFNKEFIALIDSNVVDMLEPEYSAISKIVNADRLVSSCHTGDAVNHQFPDVLSKLLLQNVKKALAALGQYQHEPEKFSAVAKMAIAADREYSRISGTGFSASLIDALVRYLKNNLDYYRKKIKEEHDFGYIALFYNTYKEIAILKSEDNFDEMVNELKNLYRFKLELEVKAFREEVGGSGWEQKDFILTKGTAHLVCDIKKQYNTGTFPSAGYNFVVEGLGKFVSQGKSVHPSKEETLNSAVIEDPFYKMYRIEMNLCESFGQIRVKSPGGSPEKWQGDEPLTWTLNYVPAITNIIFDEVQFNGIEDHKFPFSIDAGAKILMDQEYKAEKFYEESKQLIKAELKLTITHDPK